MLQKLLWGAYCLMLMVGAGCRQEFSKDGLAALTSQPKAWSDSSLRFSNGLAGAGSSNFYSYPERAGWPEWKRRAALYEPLMHLAASRHGVEARWLWIIAFLETRFRPEPVSLRQARGLMQFTPTTAKSYGLADPHQPAAAIDAAARLVRALAVRFGGRFDLVLAAYNAGEGAVDAYLRGYALRLPSGRVINPQRLQTGGLPPFPETRSYVRRGLALEQFLTNEKHGPR